MKRIIGHLLGKIRSTDWARTSALSCVSAGILFLVCPYAYLAGQGPGLAFAAIFMLVLSQLACWFGGLFRYVAGAICIVSSIVFALTGVAALVSTSGPDVVALCFFCLCIAGIPLYLRAQLYRQAAAVSPEIDRLCFVGPGLTKL